MQIPVIIIVLGQRLTDAQRAGRTTAHFCWWENKLQCLPCGHALHQHPVFGVLKPQQLKEGLTPDEYVKIALEVEKFMKECKTCPEPLKP